MHGPNDSESVRPDCALISAVLLLVPPPSVWIQMPDSMYMHAETDDAMEAQKRARAERFGVAYAEPGAGGNKKKKQKTGKGGANSEIEKKKAEREARFAKAPAP